MFKQRYWQRIPTTPVLDALPHIRWQRIDDRSPGAGTAALMLYVTLCFMADEKTSVEGFKSWEAEASYDRLGEMTGLSRQLISQGLVVLQERDLITASGSRQRRRYQIVWAENRWFKLPCQAIVAHGSITPFRHLTLRSKHELHAMKLYLYLAAVRDNPSPYSMASYETIFDRIGIPERDIRKAISILIGCGLMVNVARNGEEGEFGPNRYYLTGYQKLFSTPVTSPE